MNLLPVPLQLLVSTGLVALALPLAASAAPRPVYEENFNTPTGDTFIYPPTGAWAAHLNGTVAGWSGNGAVAITYGSGLGAEGGGLKVAVERAGTNFAVCQVKIRLDQLGGSIATVDYLRKLTVSFSLTGDAGLSVNTALQSTLKDNWANRLQGPTTALSPKWTEVRFSLGSLPAAALEKFAQEVDSSGSNEVALCLYMKDFADWQQGESFRVDNLKVTAQ